MRKLALLLVVFVIYGVSNGQNSLEDTSAIKSPRFKYSYGISPSINTSYFGNSNLYSASIGFGFGFFYDFQIPTTQILGVSQLGFQNYNYQVPDKGTVVNTSNITLGLGVKYPIGFLDNSGLILKYSGHQLIAAKSTFQGIKRPGPNEINLLNKVKNKLSHGIYLGFDFDLKEKSSLEFGYTYVVNKNKTTEYVDAIPNSISLKYNIKFSEFIRSKSDLDIAKETINLLANDTLYFINQTCQDELPNMRLDSILRIYYSFSAFKVLEEAEIAKTSLQPNTIHFAVLGSYFAGEGEPTSSGIYLLDKNLINTKAPYPNFKQLEFDLGINKELCIGDIGNAIGLIVWLNSKLSNF